MKPGALKLDSPALARLITDCGALQDCEPWSPGVANTADPVPAHSPHSLSRRVFSRWEKRVPNLNALNSELSRSWEKFSASSAIWSCVTSGPSCAPLPLILPAPLLLRNPPTDCSDGEAGLEPGVDANGTCPSVTLNTRLFGYTSDR